MVELKKGIEQKQPISLEYSFFPFNEFQNLNQDLKHHLYRITQELCSNTIKHAQASEITLSMTVYGDQVLYLYEDNGKGFNATLRKNGIGLSNIEERINLLRASFRIDSKLGSGTHISIEIPLI